jgi:hypothetical protein
MALGNGFLSRPPAVRRPAVQQSAQPSIFSAQSAFSGQDPLFDEQGALQAGLLLRSSERFRLRKIWDSGFSRKTASFSVFVNHRMRVLSLCPMDFSKAS